MTISETQFNAAKAEIARIAKDGERNRLGIYRRIGTAFGSVGDEVEARGREFFEESVAFLAPETTASGYQRTHVTLEDSRAAASLASATPTPSRCDGVRVFPSGVVVTKL